MDLNHPKLKVIIRSDFLNYSGLEHEFQKCDSCIWCLGVPQSRVSAEEYHTITCSYTIETAKFLRAVNPNISFVFMSGGGADSKETSRLLFAREKGKTENELKRIFTRNLVIVRQGGINPVIKPKNVPFYYKLFYPFFPLLKFTLPNSVISSVELSRVLLFLVKNGSSKIMMENTDLNKLFNNLS